MSDAPGPASEKADSLDPADWLDAHGDVLFRFALARVRSPETAEDLVQETFLSAVKARQTYGNRSTVRTWLIGILKHKIIDLYRKKKRETSFTDLEFLKDEFAGKFEDGGYWNHDLGPQPWKPPAEEVLHRDEFWRVLQECMAKLPPRIADVFRLREMDDFDSKEICTSLSISESNLWVMLHRARMALRECFERNWFAAPTEGKLES